MGAAPLRRRRKILRRSVTSPSAHRGPSNGGRATEAPVVGGCREKTDHDNPFNVRSVEPTKEQTMKCDKYMGM